MNATSPFIFKLSFYTPGNSGKNSAHAKYIATRPGADRGEPEIGDSETPDREVEPGPGEHTKYIDERPRSSGLFGPEGENPRLDDIQKELQEHDGVVWRMVVSLREDVANRMGYIDRQQWEDALRASVPDAAAKMNISEINLRWTAAYHAEKGHPHCHIIMWEKEPQRLKGLLSKGERKDVRKAFIRQIYAAERSRLYERKNAIRELVRDSSKGNVEKARAIVQEIKDKQIEIKADRGENPGVTPRLNKEEQKELANRLDKLSEIMPGKGRMALKYMPEEVKAEAREIADWILAQPGFNKSSEMYRDTAKELAGHYTQNKDVLDNAENNAYNDLRDRVAQTVVKGAGVINKEKLEKTKNKSLDVNRAVRGVWKGAWNAIERERTKAQAQAQAQQKALEQKRLRQPDIKPDRIPQQER